MRRANALALVFTWAVTMIPTSTAVGLCGPELAAAMSIAPNRKVAPARSPPRMPVAWCAHGLPTPALAAITAGTGVSRISASDASR